MFPFLCFIANEKPFSTSDLSLHKPTGEPFSQFPLHDGPILGVALPLRAPSGKSMIRYRRHFCRHLGGGYCLRCTSETSRVSDEEIDSDSENKGVFRYWTESGLGAYDSSTASTVLGVILEVDTGADALRLKTKWGWRWERHKHGAVRSAQVGERCGAGAW